MGTIPAPRLSWEPPGGHQGKVRRPCFQGPRLLPEQTVLTTHTAITNLCICLLHETMSPLGKDAPSVLLFYFLPALIQRRHQ